MAKGTVTRWLDGRGYGFIKGEDGKEVFVHNSEIQGKNRFMDGRKRKSVGQETYGKTKGKKNEKEEKEKI